MNEKYKILELLVTKIESHECNKPRARLDKVRGGALAEKRLLLYFPSYVKKAI